MSGDGFQFFDIILFAAIAAFLVLRLRNVLGKRTGHQQRPTGNDPFKRGPEQGGQPERERDKVIPLPDRAEPEDAVTDEELKAAAAKAETPLSAGLTQIKLADREFDEDSFLEGARKAFEMILDAYARGDSKALRPLLSNDVFQDFDAAVKERDKAGRTLDTTLVNISSTEIIEAELQGRTAFVTVKFVSEQINVLRDSEGNVIDGDPDHVTEVTDIWTFARNTRSRDPNWTLVATRSPE